MISTGLPAPNGGSVRARGAVSVGETVAPGGLEFRFAKRLFEIGVQGFAAGFRNGFRAEPGGVPVVVLAGPIPFRKTALRDWCIGVCAGMTRRKPGDFRGIGAGGEPSGVSGAEIRFAKWRFAFDGQGLAMENRSGFRGADGYRKKLARFWKPVGVVPKK